MVYGNRTRGGIHGSVDTRPEVIQSMFRLAGVTSQKNLKEFKVLDPAGGDGRFIIEYLRLLFASAKRYRFNAEKALYNVRVVEIDKKKCERTKANLREFLNSNRTVGSKPLIEKLVVNGDFLTEHFLGEKFDLVIGNPPYIRHDKIPEKKKTQYRKMFSAFRHRSDIYIGFFQKALGLISDSGKVCFICANRWMKSQYGEPIRGIIAKQYAIPLIINLEDVDAFDEPVDAYPAITIFQREDENGHVRYYDVKTVDEIDKVSRNNEAVTHVKLPKPESSNWEQIFMSDLHADNRLAPLEEQGFKLGIGVATGADSVFVRKDFPDIVEKTLLLPLVMSKDVNSQSITWSGHYLLNPFTAQGALIDLEKYPKAQRYLKENKERLASRHVGRKTPSKWYRTIDKVKPELLAKPKLILPDMKKSANFIIEEGVYYPHHNLYYITNENQEDLEMLGALLNTSFIRGQMDFISNKMSGGYVRWQAQNLRKVRIPRLDKLTTKQKAALLESYRDKKPHIAEQIIRAFNTKNGRESGNYLSAESTKEQLRAI